MEAVAAVAEANIVGLGPVFRLARPNAEQTQQQALIGHSVQIVELRMGFQFRPRRVVLVGPDPEHGVGGHLADAFDQVGVLTVLPPARINGNMGTDTVNPDLAKRIIEDCGAVAAQRPRVGHRLSPVNAVGRRIEKTGPASFPNAYDEQFEAFLGILFRQVEPHRGRISLVRFAGGIQHHVRLRLYVQRRFFPGDAVLGNRVAGGTQIPPHVPHLEETILRVVPHAVAEDHGGCVLGVGLPRLIRPENGVLRIVCRVVKRPLERRFLDEKVVDEKLAANADRDHLGRGLEIGHLHRLVGRRASGRPWLGKLHPVVEHVRPSRTRERQSKQQEKYRARQYSS